MSEIPVKIIRRRVTNPLRTPRGLFIFVDVTYSTNRLAPEVLHFSKPLYTKEKETEVILNRIRERMSDPEVTIEITSIAPEVT